MVMKNSFDHPPDLLPSQEGGVLNLGDTPRPPAGTDVPCTFLTFGTRLFDRLRASGMVSSVYPELAEGSNHMSGPLDVVCSCHPIE